MGRPVFKNEHGKVLWVGHSAWIVTDKVAIKRREKGEKVRRNMVVVNSGGAAHVCPGNAAAKWWYLEDGRRKEDDTMVVTCFH